MFVVNLYREQTGSTLTIKYEEINPDELKKCLQHEFPEWNAMFYRTSDLSDSENALLREKFIDIVNNGQNPGDYDESADAS